MSLRQVKQSRVFKSYATRKKVEDIQTILFQKVYMITNYERYKFSPDLIKFFMQSG
jgi:hypothetical protein